MFDLIEKYLFGDKMKLINIVVLFIIFIYFINKNKDVFNRIGINVAAKQTGTGSNYYYRNLKTQFNNKISKSTSSIISSTINISSLSSSLSSSSKVSKLVVDIPQSLTNYDNETLKNLNSLIDNSSETIHNVEKDMNKYCKPIINEYGDYIEMLGDSITAIEVILGLLIMYYFFSYIFTNVFSVFRTSSSCNMKKIYKYILKYAFFPIVYAILYVLMNVNSIPVLLIGLVILSIMGKFLEKNESTEDIIFFKFSGKYGKLISSSVYLTLALLVIIYILIHIYISYQLKKNYCYIRRYYDLLKQPVVLNNPELTQYIKNNLSKDLIEFNGLVLKNVILIIIIIIVVGLNTDIFEGFVKFFRSGDNHIENIAGKVSKHIADKIKEPCS